MKIRATFCARRLLLAILVLAICALTSATANANRLSIDDTDFRIAWTEAEDLNFNTGGLTFECSITLVGSFHSQTIRKVLRALIGSVARVTFGDCDQGTLTLIRAPPWHLTYEGFRGTLPNITGGRLLLRGQRFLISKPEVGANCVMPNDDNWAGTANLEGGFSRSFSVEPTPTTPIDDLAGSSLCDLAGTMTFSGTGIVDDNAGAGLGIRLI